MTTPNEKPVAPVRPDYLRIWADTHAQRGTLDDVSRIRATLYQPAYAAADTQLATMDDADAKARASHAIAMKAVDMLMATHSGVTLVSEAETDAQEKAGNAVNDARKDYAGKMQEYQQALEAWQRAQDNEAPAG